MLVTDSSNWSKNLYIYTAKSREAYAFLKEALFFLRSWPTILDCRFSTSEKWASISILKSLSYFLDFSVKSPTKAFIPLLNSITTLFISCVVSGIISFNSVCSNYAITYSVLSSTCARTSFGNRSTFSWSPVMMVLRLSFAPVICCSRLYLALSSISWFTSPFCSLNSFVRSFSSESLVPTTASMNVSTLTWTSRVLGSLRN